MFFLKKKLPRRLRPASTSCYYSNIKFMKCFLRTSKHFTKTFIRMARPIKEKKTVFVQFNVWLSEEKADYVKCCYNDSGCSTKAQFLLEILHDYKRIKQMKVLDETLMNELIKHRNLLSNATSNINQVAKQINTLGYASSEKDIKLGLEKMLYFVDILKKRSDELLEKAYSIMNL